MRLCVKKSAEALKLRKGKEPIVNPDTGEYFDKKLILDVFKNECFDNGARLPWGHLSPVSQSALSPGQIASRRKYAKAEKGNSPPVPGPSSNYSLPYSILYHGGMGRLWVAWVSSLLLLSGLVCFLAHWMQEVVNVFFVRVCMTCTQYAVPM